MHRLTDGCGLSALLVLICLAPVAMGQGLPSDTYVQYYIHEDPGDPDSAVAYEIGLILNATERSGDSVRWSVAEARIKQNTGVGSSAATWIDESPSVDTPSGEWWVDHADADNPTAADFVEPPPIAALADPDEGATEKLSFELEGLAYAEPLDEGALWEAAGALAYELRLEGEQEPIAEDPGEPVELPPVQAPPEIE